MQWDIFTVAGIMASVVSVIALVTLCKLKGCSKNGC